MTKLRNQSSIDYADLFTIDLKLRISGI